MPRKLSESDVQRVEEALGEDRAKRIARKFKDRQRKRNKVSLVVKQAYDTSDMIYDDDPLTKQLMDQFQKERTFEIRKGGTAVAEGLLEYRPPGHGEQGSVQIKGIQATGSPQMHVEELHAKEAGKVLTPGDAKQTVAKLKQTFPKAETVHGERVTGVKGGKGGNIIKMPSVERARAIIKRAGKASAAGLAGSVVLAGQKAHAAEPVEKEKVKRFMEAGTKEAGIAASIAGAVALASKFKKGKTALRGMGRVMLPVGAAVGVHDIVHAGIEGSRAFSASQTARREAKKSAESYGTIEAATATRKAREKERKMGLGLKKAQKGMYNNMSKEMN